MPIKFNEKQTQISFCGDICLTAFPVKDCDGIAWLLLQEGPHGKIGRELSDEEIKGRTVESDGSMFIGKQDGVFFATDNYRSLDVLISYLQKLREELKEVDTESVEAKNDR